MDIMPTVNTSNIAVKSRQIWMLKDFHQKKLDTNELVLELTVLAYNILRLIGQESLKNKRSPKSKHPIKRRRIKTVISNLIQIAGHVTTHGQCVVLALSRSNIWRQAFMDVYKHIALV